MEPGVVFVLVQNNKILMQQRDENCTRFPFMWCLPGGGKESGETHEDTLLREVKEEYNLDLNLDQCTHVMDYKDEDDPLRVYVCRLHDEQRPELKEGLAMKWMSLEEIEKLKLAFHQEGIIPVLKKVIG